MENYTNRDNFRSRGHIVEVTFQTGRFKGTIQMTIYGYKQGLNVIDEAVDAIRGIRIDGSKNNIGLAYVMDGMEEHFECTLTDQSGNELVIKGDYENIERLIVKTEIIRCDVLK